MSIGDRLYRQGPRLYPPQHYPEETVTPTVLRGALQQAYSYAQHGGRHIGTWVQPIDLADRTNLSLHTVATGTLKVASWRAYLPEHWDRIVVAAVWYGGSPQWRLNISSTGAWRTPDEATRYDSQLVTGLLPLTEFRWSEEISSGLSRPDVFGVSVEAGGVPDAGTGVVFGPYLVTAWGEVDGG